MPPKSKQQMKAAQIAEGVKAGKVKAKPGSPSASMAQSMKPQDLKAFATAPQGSAKLPLRVKPKPAGRTISE